MPEFTGNETEFVRPGNRTAYRLPIVAENPLFVATVSHWLVTYPPAHPLWSQYILCGIELDDYPNMPKANKQFPEATHEIMLAALNPEHGPYTPENMTKYWTVGSPEEGKLPILLPINIAWQFKGTDDECNKLVTACARSITINVLWPETADAPERIRMTWARSLGETLKHLRGEAHDTSGNDGCQH